MAPPTSCCLFRGVWSTIEHERFLEALAMYPQGPWPLITAHIGTRSAKQVQTHAQKYLHKLRRHQRGLRKWKTKSKRPEHRVDTTTAEQMIRIKGWSIVSSQRKRGCLTPAKPARENDKESDCSTHSKFDAWMEVIEPVPFQSTFIASYCTEVGMSVSEDHLLLEALAAILG